jgi:hypothetical protein
VSPGKKSGALIAPIVASICGIAIGLAIALSDFGSTGPHLPDMGGLAQFFVTTFGFTLMVWIPALSWITYACTRGSLKLWVGVLTGLLSGCLALVIGFALSLGAIHQGDRSHWEARNPSPPPRVYSRGVDAKLAQCIARETQADHDARYPDHYHDRSVRFDRARELLQSASGDTLRLVERGEVDCLMRLTLTGEESRNVPPYSWTTVVEAAVANRRIDKIVLVTEPTTLEPQLALLTGVAGAAPRDAGNPPPRTLILDTISSPIAIAGPVSWEEVLKVSNRRTRGEGFFVLRRASREDLVDNPSVLRVDVGYLGSNRRIEFAPGPTPQPISR